jgi:Ca2+/Na+ antiporter
VYNYIVYHVHFFYFYYYQILTSINKWKIISEVIRRWSICLSMFQLYCYLLFYWWRLQEYAEKTTKPIISYRQTFTQSCNGNKLSSKYEEIEDIKGVIRIRKSKKNRQPNGLMKKSKTTNNDLQNTTQKTIDRATWTPLNTRVELASAPEGWLTDTAYLCDKWPQICSVCRNHNPVLSSFMTYHQVCT